MISNFRFKISFRIAAAIFLASVFCFISQAQASTTELVGSYNAFNQHMVVLECTNTDSEPLQIQIELYRNNGALVGTQNRTLAVNASEHIILNSFADFRGRGIENDYGVFVIREAVFKDISSLHCLASHYRLAGDHSVEYAFSLPVIAPLKGETYGIYNSIDPSGLNRAPTQNWLTVYNPSKSETFSANVELYLEGQSTPQSTTRIQLSPYQRTDLPLAFQNGQQVTGTYRLLPDSASQAYGSFLTRYFTIDGSRFEFAFYLAALKGSCGTRVPASTTAQADNWLEIANASSRSVPFRVEVQDNWGQLLFRHPSSINLGVKRQHHLYLNSILDPQNRGAIGSVKVLCDRADDKLLIQSAFYGHPSVSDRTLSWAYVSQAETIQLATSSDQLVAFANTFLNAANWLKLTSQSSVSGNLSQAISSLGGVSSAPVSILLAGNGSYDMAVHEQVGADFAGTVLVEAENNDAALYSAQLLRVFQGPKAEINYIMPVPVVVTGKSGIQPGEVCPVPSQCAPGAALRSISWSLLPSTSSVNPTKYKGGVAKITTAVECATVYKIERVSAAGVPENDSAFPTWTDSLETAFTLTNGWGAEGVTYYRISAWTANENEGGRRVSNYSNSIPVYYNYNFQDLKFNITVDCSTSPGNCVLQANPHDGTLASQITQYQWSEMAPERDASGQVVYISDGGKRIPKFRDVRNSFQHTSANRFTVSLPQCGVRYFHLYGAWNGIAGHTERKILNSGINSYSAPLLDAGANDYPMPVAILQRDSVGTCGNLAAVSGVPTANIYNARTIPGTFRFAFLSSQISLFSGGTINLPLRGGNPQYVELQFPTDIALASYLPKIGASDAYTSTDISSSVRDGSLPSGYKRYRLEKLHPDCDSGQNDRNCNWSYNNDVLSITPVFLQPSVVGRSGMSMYVRALSGANESSRTDNWQVIPINAKAVPSITLPRRLLTAVGWANEDLFPNSATIGYPSLNFDFFSIYKSLGFNVVPLVQSHYYNPVTRADLFYPTRSGNKWSGLVFGPEHSTFAGGYSGPGVYTQLRLSEQDVSAFDFAPYGLTASQAIEERSKWLRAVRYNAQTEENDIDLAYDGFWFEQDLKNLSDTVRVGRPEIIFLDIEDVPRRKNWEESVFSSANALRRRRPCETKQQLAARMADEFLGRVVSAIRSASPGTAIGFYDYQPAHGNGFRVFTGAMFKKYGIIGQPSMYGLALNLKEALNTVQQSKKDSGSNLLIPWMSTGNSGFTTPKQVFDSVIHTLFSGANGYSYYSFTDFIDGGHYLSIAEANGIAAGVENIIMDGTPAQTDISNLSNGIVSAMKKNGEYIFAVTPINTSLPVTFNLAAPTGVRTLRNLRAGTLQVLGTGAVSFNLSLSDTAVYRLSSS